ncbi:hypothetical protein PUNSTDRAFT_144355 [Punctularia strigosozonata HHB-11173 SS5]|uniref:uncharacterized protein n=1 Tax=Punctularia strigosozonata (strain HHB-11173) TaxID=741275 RepID=UPI0004417EEF|nr:uncharacterized protein PUNSTDRAFT_144355 [Punctularia strigosozonata HHB-11173 SS5]EIN07852.1 hypothetical protein PUNSTDRAFT_144355 [Punctularia strigosozonata HHB-11173 SS5]
MKKAYELGVLCSVDIAVIVFEDRQGHKPKLYEYCSTEIRHIVQRHMRFDGERDTKGPMDFGGSKAEDGGDDDDGDDDDTFSSGSPNMMRTGQGAGMASGGMAPHLMALTPTQMQHLQPSFGMQTHPSAFPSSLERSRSNTIPSYPGQKRPRLDHPVRTPYGFGLDMTAHSQGHTSNVGSHTAAHHYSPSTAQYPNHSSTAPSNSFPMSSNSASLLRGSGNFTPRTGQLHAASFEMDNGFDWPVHHTGSTNTNSAVPTNQPRSSASSTPHQAQTANSDPSAWLDGFLGSSSSASPSTHAGVHGNSESQAQGLALPMPNISGTRRPSMSMGATWDRSHDGASTPRMGQGSHDTTPRLGHGHDVLGKRDRESSGDGSSNGHGRSGGSPRIKRENMDDGAVAIVGGQA